MNNKNISLAVKYRPTEWESLTEQEYIKTILENQINKKSVKNAYLFTGPAGCGKTTSARIFANNLNFGVGNVIEVDAASNNGVDDVRKIIDDAKFKPLNTRYKIYILDEVHQFSQGAWNAMLKLLEEPPKTAIFIMCTTNPEKIPATILSRVQRFDFNKISQQGIVERLEYIVKCETHHVNTADSSSGYFCDVYIPSITYDKQALEYIAKVADGRAEKCNKYVG